MRTEYHSSTEREPDFFGQWERPWDDATTPRTDLPPRFIAASRPFIVTGRASIVRAQRGSN